MWNFNLRPAWAQDQPRNPGDVRQQLRTSPLSIGMVWNAFTSLFSLHFTYLLNLFFFFVWSLHRKSYHVISKPSLKVLGLDQIPRLLGSSFQILVDLLASFKYIVLHFEFWLWPLPVCLHYNYGSSRNKGMYYSRALRSWHNSVQHGSNLKDCGSEWEVKQTVLVGLKIKTFHKNPVKYLQA